MVVDFAAPPWNHVDASGDCWLWVGSLDGNGYGMVRVGGGRGHTRRAHRHVYELLIGPIPTGLEIDHLCRNRGCVNPDHLEIVTRLENFRRGYSPMAISARQTHCKRGHPFDEVNTYRVHGSRSCRPCVAMRGRAYRDRHPERVRVAKHRQYEMRQIRQLAAVERGERVAW